MENKHSEEIDLISVFKSIKKGINNFSKSIKNLIIFSFKNIKTLLALIFIGVSISISMFYLKKMTYVSDFTISHTRLNNGECYGLINGLTKLRENDVNGNTILAKKLGINVNMAEQIISISCKALNENLEKNYKDSAFVLLPFKVEARVYSPSILDSLQKGILNYLESNEYAKKRKKVNEEYLEKYEEKIKSEIVAIDSLKRLVDKSIIPRGLGNGIILGEPIDPVKVYQAGMDLYKSQLSIIEQKQFNNSFEVIIGFSPAIASQSLLLNIFVGFILSLILGLLWLIRKKSNSVK